MATSIDKSVNWRKSADTPDYQVTARRVDTFVQPERNTKGEQVAAALEQAAGTVTQVGKQLHKEKRLRQEAAIKDTAERIKASKKADPNYDYLDDPLFTGHPEYMRIQLAQIIGASQNSGFQTDEEGNKTSISFDEIQDHLSKNPEIMLNAGKLDEYLGGIQVNIDAEDGYNINYQAAHRQNLEQFKIKLRSQAVAARKEDDRRTAEFGYEQALLGALNDPNNKTNAEKLAAAEAADKAFIGLGNSYRKEVQYRVFNDYATDNRNPHILLDETMPEIFKNESMSLSRQRIAATMLREARAEEAHTASMDAYDKRVKFTQFQNDTLAIMRTRYVSPDEFDDFEKAEWVQRQNTIGIAHNPNQSKLNRKNMVDELTQNVLAGKELKIGDKSFPKTLEGIQDYIMFHGGMNEKDVQIALEDADAILTGANLDKNQIFMDTFAVVDSILNDVYGSDTGKKIFFEKTRRTLKRQYYKDLILLTNDPDGLTPADETNLFQTYEKRARYYADLHNGMIDPSTPEPKLDGDTTNTNNTNTSGRVTSGDKITDFTNSLY